MYICSGSVQARNEFVGSPEQRSVPEGYYLKKRSWRLPPSKITLSSPSSFDVMY